MSYDRAYADLRVIDLSQGIAGPYCGSLLALHGADVVKIEPPDGDWVRRLGALHGELSSLALCGNRGKRSIAIDLKKEKGRDIVLAMARRADVLIEGFRPGVMDRLGLGYQTIRDINPRVLYLSVSGYGQSGPYRDRPCTDTVVQAYSGLMAVNRGPDGTPRRIGFTVADMVTALYAFQALAVAIHARSREDEGRHIDVSLIQSAAAIQSANIVEHVLTDGEPDALNAPAGTYRTADGWMAVTLVTETQFAAMCDALEMSTLADDPRFVNFQTRARHLDELVPLVQERILTRSTAEWCARFERAGALAHAVYDYRDWLEDTHVRAIDAAPMLAQPGLGSVPLPRIPGMPPVRPDDPPQLAPGIGEHGYELLLECGYAQATIDALVSEGAVRLGASQPSPASD